MVITAIYPDNTTREYTVINLTGWDFTFRTQLPCYFIVPKGTSEEDKTTLAKLCKQHKVETTHEQHTQLVQGRRPSTKSYVSLLVI